ncbi:beta-glucosidase family protein [Novosphingobium profundi]|uniref:beta-glucosidase family protein n=1 Tax=Novosphingobium profundi TaxID=1774954 RepID=UPI001CFCC0BF|nr:beta-glucosidase [Novosphingobium profundi]
MARRDVLSIALTGTVLIGAGSLPGTAHAQTSASSHAGALTHEDMLAARQRAEAIVAQMEPQEKTYLTWGVMPLPIRPNSPPPPEGAIPAAGFVPGIARLGIPNLTETDGPAGISYVQGLRGDYATAMPSGIALGASFDRDLAYEQGRTIGQEARAKGFNVLLAGGANLARDPRNGRTFEYIAEDPLLTGQVIGANIAGVQSNHIVSTIKHFALNGQETGRRFVDVKISDKAARESDLLAFQIGIEIGQPGSVMCAYNKVNTERGCASEYLLNKVLKTDWNYQGWVMSDWGAVPGLYAAWNGLDQQSGAGLDPDVFFDDTLLDAAKADPARMDRLDDMNARVLTGLAATGVLDHPVKPGGAIDWKAHADVALRSAQAGIVLLKNAGDILPLASDAKSILVVGGNADFGVLSGGGSSQVHGEGGPAFMRPLMNSGAFASMTTEQYQRGAPLEAIRKRKPGAVVRYRPGRYASDAAALAAQMDMVIVFANQWMAEGIDVSDLGLPEGQDAMIAAIAKANPRTVVVLQTGGAIDMPWLDDVAAVIEAWYPGQEGDEAIAGALFGEFNPSGRLPITFPRTTAQLPREDVPGMIAFDPIAFGSTVDPSLKLETDYNIEGAEIGYRWNAKEGHKALFPFGYGLSYTTFRSDGLKTDGKTARFSVTNTGARAGRTLGQVYLVSRDGKPNQRLVGFERVTLLPGETKRVQVSFDPRLLAEWNGAGWTIPAGTYGFALGENAEDLGATVTVRLKARSWRD